MKWLRHEEKLGKTIVSHILDNFSVVFIYQNDWHSFHFKMLENC